MAVGYYFAPESMSPEQYDAVTSQLAAAGQGAPAGRLYHCAFTEGGSSSVHVFDVWESGEAFEAFGQTLMPILAEVGVDPGQPQVAAIHNIIAG
ncbi:MAG: hypothetical protein QOK40_2512 [Miltoncostaeaceae bacterium]|jgi:quinol monooxygenase YgiN|nr:hypothetical protein [Miltoncostaeaceae bacterium]